MTRNSGIRINNFQGDNNPGATLRNSRAAEKFDFGGL